MLAKLLTFSVQGIHAVPVTVEVDISLGAPLEVVWGGLSAAVTRESRHRIEQAIVFSGFQLPQGRVVIKLSPAQMVENAAPFDLPIALGILAGSGQFISARFPEHAVVGELSLEGSVRQVKGAISIAKAMAEYGDLRGMVLPRENAPEAATVEEIEAIAVSSLAEAVCFFTGETDTELQP